MEAKGFKRKKYFLKNSPQPKLVLRIYLILITVMLLSGAIFYVVGYKSLTREFYQAHSAVKSTMQLLLPALILVNFIGLLGASFLVVAFTHSIAGPIHRLKNLSERIAEGDLSLEVKFRNRDTVHELSGVINKISKGLNSRVKEFEGSLYKLHEISAKISDIDRLPPNELNAFKNALISVSAELEKKVKQFKL